MHFFKTKFFLFISFFIIGVILSIISIVNLNHTYANASEKKDDLVVTMVPFYWMIMLIGGLILITLSYVSWRKYKGTQARRKDRGANN